MNLSEGSWDLSHLLLADRGLSLRFDSLPVAWFSMLMANRYIKREQAVHERFCLVGPTLDERGRRLFAAAEAMAFGYGGVLGASRATGLSRTTILRGITELQNLEERKPRKGFQRQQGAGRPTLVQNRPQLLSTLLGFVDPVTRGDPESPLLWTSKSGAKLAKALMEKGFSVSRHTVLRLLRQAGFRLQAARKTKEGASHVDRDAQFQRIHDEAISFMEDGQPVISIDTKKKELVGDYKNVGQEWHQASKGPRVSTYDFPNGVPKAVPYGVYDIARNDGWVSVGISSDTAEFAVSTIGRWWKNMGKTAYPEATALLITADCGGSNGYRLRLWRLMLQKLADETGLAITVAHFPPGTSKWNKIEHRMFSMISMNWRGQALVSYETIVELIGSTTSKQGLTIRCELDQASYETGRKVTDQELDAVHIERWEFHGEWNYTIYPTATI